MQTQIFTVHISLRDMERSSLQTAPKSASEPLLSVQYSSCLLFWKSLICAAVHNYQWSTAHAASVRLRLTNFHPIPSVLLYICLQVWEAAHKAVLALNISPGVEDSEKQR